MRTLASFKDVHRSGQIIVCGCGSSLNSLERPERFITIGVNDVGRLFDPNYLVVVDPRDRFKSNRFDFVENSKAGYLFTQRADLNLTHPDVVPFRLGQKDGTDFSDPDVLHYGVITPYVALCLAIHMGATNIGLIGVDFTDNHFFGETGQHEWAPHITTIDAQFERLSRAAFARNVRIFNLSRKSRVTALPKMDLETFAALGVLGSTQRASPQPLNIVSYATTPLVGVPATLARCINARTPHQARCVWASAGYVHGISFEDDVSWFAAPARAMAALEAADVVVVHNGKIDDRHRSVLQDKPVIVMAHNYMANVDNSLVLEGYPGLVVGQYQATLPEFDGWSAVPNPMSLWEEKYNLSQKNSDVTIVYTPACKDGSYPIGHARYWHAKGYDATMRILDRLAARLPIRIEVARDGFVPHAEAMAMKRRAHIVIDECVTGSYHRNSLEGLAAGCVVVNGVGLLSGIPEMLRYCAGGATDMPFICSDLASLEDILELLAGLGPKVLEAHGALNRQWLEYHWDFWRQWSRFWQPAIEKARSVSLREDLGYHYFGRILALGEF